MTASFLAASDPGGLTVLKVPFKSYNCSKRQLLGHQNGRFRGNLHSATLTVINYLTPQLNMSHSLCTQVQVHTHNAGS